MMGMVGKREGRGKGKEGGGKREREEAGPKEFIFLSG